MDVIRKAFEKYHVPLSDESIGKLASTLTRKEYQREEIILKQGQVSRHMYIVEKGIIRQFYYKDGRDITEHFSCEGDIAACLESLFLNEATRLNVEAIEPVVIHLFDYEKFKSLTYTHPEILRLHQAILEYQLVVSQRKADSWRFESSHERYNRFCKEYPLAARRASIAHIASYLLMAPETLSRVRAGK